MAQSGGDGSVSKPLDALSLESESRSLTPMSKLSQGSMFGSTSKFDSMFGESGRRGWWPAILDNQQILDLVKDSFLKK